jgi:hypothetical protein
MTPQNLLTRMSDQHKAQMMGVRGTSVGKDFESGCVGGVWDGLAPDKNDELLSGRRRLAKALDLAVSPRPAADCPGLGGLRRTRARPSGTSCPLTWGQGNSPFSFAAMDSS